MNKKHARRIARDKKEQAQQWDVLVRPDGTVVLFALQTDAAREWVDEHVQHEPYQWLGMNNLVVGHRFASDLVEGMRAAGLAVTVGGLT